MSHEPDGASRPAGDREFAPDRLRDIRIVQCRRRTAAAGRVQLFMVCLGSVVMLPASRLADATRFARRLGADSRRPVWLETDPDQYTVIDQLIRTE